MLAALTDPTELRVVLPDESPAMEPGRLADLAVQAERLGYGAVLLPDHLLPPEPYGAAFGGVYESVQKPAAAGADSVAVWFGDHEGFGERMEEFAAAFR